MAFISLFMLLISSRCLLSFLFNSCIQVDSEQSQMYFFSCRCMESNDKSILDLIHTCAVAVLEEFLDILLLYFSRDEFG